MRALSGLNINQVIAEFRALRSSVLRLWTMQGEEDAAQDVGRFNEAIDQALAESVQVYSAEVERWQQIFLGVLGHDLRGPLNAIALTTEVIAQSAPEDLASPTRILSRSTGRMVSLLDSLLEYNRVGLGGTMTIERAPIDLAATCREEIELQHAALPGARIELLVHGDTHGEFDASRIREALGNLITNAVKHGTPSEPVTVTLDGNEEGVRLSVGNASDRDILPNEMEGLFEPLRRGAAQQPRLSDRSHLGLGLFIARQIARAHGGELTGWSSSQRVRFTLHVPKTASSTPTAHV